LYSLRLDNSVYALEAVEKAAYRFIDRFAAVISTENDRIVIDFTFDENRAADADKILADFKKELLDQNLRSKIKTETEEVRNLILAYTFSRTGLQS